MSPSTSPEPSSRPASSRAVWLALWTVYIIWGSTYLAIRVTVETFPPLLSASVRFLIAGAALLLWFRVRRGASAIVVERRQLLATLAVGTALLCGGNGLVMIAERDVPSGLAALIIAAVPLWVVIFRLAFREKVPLGTLLGVVGGFAGVGVLALVGERPEGAPLSGIVLLLLASLSWASGSFASKKVTLPKDPFVSSAYQMVGGGLVLLALAALTGEIGDFDAAAVSGASSFALLYLIVAGSAGVMAYVWLLQNAPISKVATYAYVNPVIAVFLGWVFVGEQLTGSMIAGAALIVGSVAFIIRRETQPPREDPSESRGEPVLRDGPRDRGLAAKLDSA